MGLKLSRIACQIADRYLVTYTAAQLYMVTVITNAMIRTYKEAVEVVVEVVLVVEVVVEVVDVCRNGRGSSRCSSRCSSSGSSSSRGCVDRVCLSCVSLTFRDFELQIMASVR
jgi:hypothetical protein